MQNRSQLIFFLLRFAFHGKNKMKNDAFDDPVGQEYCIIYLKSC